MLNSPDAFTAAITGIIVVVAGGRGGGVGGGVGCDFCSFLLASVTVLGNVTP